MERTTSRRRGAGSMILRGVDLYTGGDRWALERSVQGSRDRGIDVHLYVRETVKLPINALEEHLVELRLLDQALRYSSVRSTKAINREVRFV